MRIFLEAPLGTAAMAPLAVRVVTDEPVLQLASRGAEATAQVSVVIDATDKASALRMRISTDAAGSEVVAIPSEPIVIEADGNAMRRSAQFELTAKTTGTATVGIAVTDGASTATVALRVVVADPPADATAHFSRD